MKKIKYIITFFILFFYYDLTYAQIPDSCQIKDNPPNQIKEYIKNVNQMISKISSKAQKWKKSPFKSSLIWGLNSIINFEDYEVEFRYYLIEPTFNSIPKPIKRDIESLNKLQENLNYLLSRYSKTWLYDVEIDTKWLCNSDCNLTWKKKAWLILLDLLNSTKKLKEVIQRAASDNVNISNCNQIFFINCKEIYDIYKNSKFQCQDDEYEKKIKKISFNFKLSNKATKDWIDAWNLLTWKTTLTNNQEKKLLKKELDRQWIPSWQAKIILKNLEDYNNWKSISIFNNPIKNIKNTLDNIISKDSQNEVKSFLETLKETLKGKKEVPIQTAISKTISNKKNIRKETNIDLIYNSLLPIAQKNDVETNKSLDLIIDANVSMINSINILWWRTKKLSEKVCNEQWQGQWICKY